MALIDSLTLALSALPSPLTKDNKTDLTVTATTKLAGSNADADRVEFSLQFVPRVDTHTTTGFNGDGLMPILADVTKTTSDSTGVFTATFTAAQMSQPGAYKILVKAFTIVSSLITVQEVAVSDVFYVQDVNGADQLNNFLSDLEKAELDNQNIVVWETTTLTGALLKAATGSNSGTAKTVKLATLPANAVLVGGMISVVVADGGSNSAATATLGANSSSYDNLLGATDIQTTGSAGDSVAESAGSTSLKSVITVTGDTIADIDDATEVTYTWGYAVPKAHALAV